MTVRRATPADLDAIASVHLPAFVAAHGEHMAPERLAAITHEERRGKWEPVLAAIPPRSTVLVAETEAGIVGVAGSGPVRDEGSEDAGTGELYALYVHPDHWGSGQGEALHRAALEHLADEGFSEAILWVLGPNARARGFYESRGWQADGGRGEWSGSVRVRLRRALEGVT